MLVLGTTVYGGLDKGVFLGIFLSVVAYLRSASHPKIEQFFGKEAEQRVPAKIKGKATILQIAGSVFFGSVHTVEKVLTDLSRLDDRQSHLVIDGEYLHHLDIAGAETLVQEAKKRQKNGYQLAFLLRDHNLDEVLQRGGLINVLGRENIYYIHKHIFSGSFGGGYCQNFRRETTLQNTLTQRSGGA